MSLVPQMAWEECPLEPADDGEVARVVRRVGRGALPPGAEYLVPCPWIVTGIGRLVPTNGLLAHLDMGLGELVFLVVSHANSCRYCYASHRALMRFLGTSEGRIRQLEQDLFTAQVEPRERAVLEFARRLSRASPLLRRADVSALEGAGVAPDEAREVAFVVASAELANRVATLPALPTAPLEELLERPWARLLSPLVGWWQRRRVRPGAPASLAEEQRRGPYSQVVQSLDGLPAARALRRTLDDCLASPFLPRRARLLCFAVIARGLGCGPAEREALGLLAGEGLAEGEVREILAHLSSPRLDPLEARIVPFARDTIWYQPVQIQRRARDLLGALGRERFLDLVGTVALANAVCRLDGLFDG